MRAIGRVIGLLLPLSHSTFAPPSFLFLSSTGTRQVPLDVPLPPENACFCRCCCVEFQVTRIPRAPRHCGKREFSTPCLSASVSSRIVLTLFLSTDSTSPSVVQDLTSRTIPAALYAGTGMRGTCAYSTLRFSTHTTAPRRSKRSQAK